MLMVSGSVTMLDGDYDASVAGGAHLHLATAGNNGDISVGLNPEVAEDLKSATFSVAENTFTLDADQVEAIRSNGMYANIHTTTVPSGEARGQLVGELNLAPLASMIVAPADGAELTLEGRTDSVFMATYASTTDPSGDSIMYIWQLATDEAFENLVLAVNTGRDTFFATDYGTVDSLLAQVGVDTGATATVYHRVLASDGSNFTPSAGASVVLTRGDLVGNRDFRPLGFAAVAYPNPARAATPITYELTTREAFRAQLQIFTTLGQVQHTRVVEATIGTQRIELSAELPVGTYFVMLRHESGQLIEATRLIVQ
jgi:hypothetical protein